MRQSRFSFPAESGTGNDGHTQADTAGEEGPDVLVAEVAEDVRVLEEELPLLGEEQFVTIKIGDLLVHFHL